MAEEFFTMVDGLVQAGERSERVPELYRQRDRTHLAPHLGRRRIQSIRPKDLSDLLAELRKQGLSPNTVSGIFTQAGAILQHAVVRGYRPD